MGYNKGIEISTEDNVPNILLFIYGIIVAACFILYLPKFIQLAHGFWHPSRKEATERRKIAVLIPARNESAIIGDLFASIKAQTYPKEYFDVFVILQSADDPTLKMCNEAGFTAYIVPNQTCKGDALDGCFREMGEKIRDYDAFSIVDADAVLTPTYVEELNNALEYDCDIFVTKKNIKNYLGDRSARSVFCNCSALNYAMVDELGNNYRTKREIPVDVCGQGMMVRRAVVEATGGWPYRTLTEDYELKLDGIIRGFRSMYYPYAVIYTEEVIRHKDCYRRRMRWLTGFLQCKKKYRSGVNKKIRERKPGYAELFDCSFSLIPLIAYLAATFLAAGAGASLFVLYLIRSNPLFLSALLLMTVPLGGMYVLAFLYSALAALTYRDVFRPLSFWEKCLMLIVSPFFQLEYFPIFIQSFLRTHGRGQATVWEATERVNGTFQVK